MRAYPGRAGRIAVRAMIARLKLNVRRKRKVIIAILALGFAVLAIANWQVGTYFLQPRPRTAGPLPPDLPGREVTFPSESGSQLRGWLIPAGTNAPVVICLHGVRGHRGGMLSRARFLHAAGYNVLAFDFQAHGESPGQHITFGYLEARDVTAAVEFVRRECPGSKIAVLGVSLGGVAAALAKPNPAVDAMILEMIYPTIDQAVEDRMAIVLGPAGKWLAPLLTWQIPFRLGISTSALRPIDTVATLTMPKLFIAGTADDHTTIAEARAIVRAAAEPKEFWEAPGVGHQDLHALAPKEYEKRILDFLKARLL